MSVNSFNRKFNSLFGAKGYIYIFMIFGELRDLCFLYVLYPKWKSTIRVFCRNKLDTLSKVLINAIYEIVFQWNLATVTSKLLYIMGYICNNITLQQETSLNKYMRVVQNCKLCHVRFETFVSVRFIIINIKFIWIFKNWLMHLILCCSYKAIT